MKNQESDAILAAHDLSIGYHLTRKSSKVLADHLNLALIPGEVVCLIGPNGVGKSTLLRTLAALQPSLSGSILLDNRELDSMDAKERARSIGIVLTERVNVGMLSSFALVALGRHPYTGWSGRLTAEDHAAVEWALQAVGAEELSSQHVAEISDGERQKVMIARALAQEPRLIILDEPTAYLDLPRRAEIMSLLKRLARTTHRAIILSTHDLELALRSADRMWLLSHGKNICGTDTPGGKAATISTGAPEDLALDGSMGNTFESEGVTFDQRHGSFVIAADRDESVYLSGSGLPNIWTKRALAREGFRISKSPDSCRIRINISSILKDKNEWDVRVGDDRCRCNSIYELIRFIHNHVRPNSADSLGVIGFRRFNQVSE